MLVYVIHQVKSPLDTETNDHYLLLNLGWFAQFEDAVVFVACRDYDLKNCYYGDNLRNFVTMGTINSPLHIFWAMNQMHLCRHLKMQNDRLNYIEMSQIQGTHQT